MQRLRTFMQTTNAPPWEVVTDDDIPAMLDRPVWTRTRGHSGERAELFDPVFFFTTYRFDGRLDAIRNRVAAAHPTFDPARLWSCFFGYRHFTWYNCDLKTNEPKPNPANFCRPCWRLNPSPGCPHQCAYCHLTGFMVMGLNMSDYLAHLDKLMDANPWQQTYLADDGSDVLVYEPELNVFSELVRFFGRKDNRYLIAHTKSGNVDFLETLPHNGKTIMCYSLSAQTQSTQLEKGAATTRERIEAARKCQEWGMPVRFKFKPIIPVKGWRDEARDMIREVFDNTRPDNLSMTVMMWMDFEAMAACIDLDRLDPKFVDAARKAADEEWEHDRVRPFPHEVRREIYEFYRREVRAIDRDIPLTLCTETQPMWRDIGAMTGMEPATYTCGCGPNALPGRRTLATNAWKIAEHRVRPEWL